ncbi:MAG TPA: response regulator [Fimbriimonadaceae bacterium]|nr:response regulator [Fimbriimonadaceae bacterium]
MSHGSQTLNRSRAGRILVCDDDRIMVRLVQAQMERYGHAVTPSYSGLEALQRLEEETFDLLILDVMMPGIDGFELLKHLRRDARTADLPVILLTGRSNDEDVFNGYHLGADVFLTKPVDFTELSVFVRSLIESGQTLD